MSTKGAYDTIIVFIIYLHLNKKKYRDTIVKYYKRNICSEGHQVGQSGD